MIKLDLAPGQTWHTDAGKLVNVIEERKTKNQWLVCMANNRHCEFTVYRTGRFIRGAAEVQNLTERATRVYIAGPSTGMPNDNHPAFHAAAAEYRKRGCFVINPAEVFAPDTAPGWVDCMRVLLPLLMTCEMIVMLPGWTQSKGARLEHHTARELGFAIVHPSNEAHPTDDQKTHADKVTDLVTRLGCSSRMATFALCRKDGNVEDAFQFLNN